MIWGALGVRRGPDSERIRNELAVQRALEQTRARIDAEIEIIGAHVLRSERAGGSPSGKGGGQGTHQVLTTQRAILTERITEQEKKITELLLDRDLWVALPEGEKRLTKADLRALRDDLLGAQRDAYRPVRDFLYMKELALMLDVDIGTIRSWIEAHGSARVSRLCPWTGDAPIHRPDQRTVLFAAAAFEETRVANPDRWTALKRLLAVWPQGRGWNPRDGAKTQLVHRLSRSPITLTRAAANNLLADADSDCVRIFSLVP